MLNTYLLKVADDNAMEFVDFLIIRANNEKQARRIANQEAGGEGKIWEDTDKVLCVDLNNKPKGLIVRVSSGF